LLSDRQEDLKRVEQSLSDLSSHLGNIMNNSTDTKPKLVRLNINVDELERHSKH
jgi:hypothetical protein